MDPHQVQSFKRSATFTERFCKVFKDTDNNTDKVYFWMCLVLPSIYHILCFFPFVRAIDLRSLVIILQKRNLLTRNTSQTLTEKVMNFKKRSWKSLPKRFEIGTLLPRISSIILNT